jgi:hypothetical protein
MSLPGKARRSFSASPEHDADADYQLALQLSEELNGEHPAPSYACPAQQPDCDDDADYALALELQFGDSSRVHMEEQGASSSGSKRGREGTIMGFARKRAQSRPLLSRDPRRKSLQDTCGIRSLSQVFSMLFVRTSFLSIRA